MTIPEQFYVDDPVKELTSATFSIFEMDMIGNNAMIQAVDEATDMALPESRKLTIAADREYVLSLSDVNEILSHMKRTREMANRRLLCMKTLEFEDGLMPELIRRWQRSNFSVFCEHASVICSQANEKYVDQIVEEFEEFQKPYGIYTCCTMLAYRKRLDALPKIMKAYKWMHTRTEIVEQDYDQTDHRKSDPQAVYELKKVALCLRRKGKSVKEICEITGLADKTVRMALEAYDEGGSDAIKSKTRCRRTGEKLD